MKGQCLCILHTHIDSRVLCTDNKHLLFHYPPTQTLTLTHQRTITQLHDLGMHINCIMSVWRKAGNRRHTHRSTVPDLLLERWGGGDRLLNIHTAITKATYYACVCCAMWDDEMTNVSGQFLLEQQSSGSIYNSKRNSSTCAVLLLPVKFSTLHMHEIPCVHSTQTNYCMQKHTIRAQSMSNNETEGYCMLCTHEVVVKCSEHEQ